MCLVLHLLLNDSVKAISDFIPDNMASAIVAFGGTKKKKKMRGRKYVDRHAALSCCSWFSNVFRTWSVESNIYAALTSVLAKRHYG